MDTGKNRSRYGISHMSPIFMEDAFSRLDEGDDTRFYSRDRLVNHLDSFALNTVKEVIGQLVVEENPVILDLMAGWDSHIPEKLKPSKVVGLGLNENELSRNTALSEVVIHDLNKDPSLFRPYFCCCYQYGIR